MPNIFSGNHGRVVAVTTPDDNYVPLGLIVGDFKTKLGAKGLLTGLSVGGQSGYQIMHTLRQYIYIYTFGERAGEVNVSGLAFVNDCTNDSYTGLARLFAWYEHNRISRLGLSMALVLTPTIVISGFLVGFRYQIEDPSISVGQFNLQFVYPPRIKPIGAPYPYPDASLYGTGAIASLDDFVIG